MSCGQLTDIKIPDTVTSIGKNAFYMSGLTSIKIPNTVTSIGEYAFFWVQFSCEDRDASEYAEHFAVYILSYYNNGR